MKPSINCLNLIKQFEGFESKAYICPAGKVTIGWGTTLYPNGEAVKIGDVCTKEIADKYLMTDLTRRADAIGELPVNQNQFDAILSLVYNIGMANWNNSTVRKLAKTNPNSAEITRWIMAWNKAKANGVLTVLPGLTRRRKAEVELYFK